MDSVPTKFLGWPRLAVWEKYENVAMHFNDLLLRLRTSALAVVATISALVGLFTKEEGTLVVSWELATVILIALTCFWIAIWVLDFSYYNRLLLGAATAIVELEKSQSEYVEKLDLSTKIKDAVNGEHGMGKIPLNYGGMTFYGIVIAVWRRFEKAGLLRMCIRLGQSRRNRLIHE